MSVELIAILVTAAFQFAGLIYIARIARALDATIRSYGAGNLLTTRNLAADVRKVDEYVRTHGAEIDRFIDNFYRQFPPFPPSSSPA